MNQLLPSRTGRPATNFGTFRLSSILLLTLLLTLPLTLLLTLAAPRAAAQTPVWQWAKRPATGPGNSSGGATAVDAAGATYITGSFSGSAAFGTIRLVSAGSADVYVAKLNAAGVWQWAVRAGGASGDERGTGLALDAAGNVYVMGNFTSATAVFGPVTLTNTTTTGDADVFVAKLSAAGVWQRAIRAGGRGYDEGLGLAVDAAGAAVVTGRFDSPQLVLGALRLTNASAGSFDVFVAKLTAAGAWQWAVRGGGRSSDDIGYDIALDPTGNVLVAGSFSGATATFGTFPLANAAAPTTDAFVAKLSAAGVWQWAKRAGGATADGASAVTTDAAGNVYLAGDFTMAALFGTIRLVSAGYADVFVAKLSAAGAWTWAKRAGGPDYDHAYGLAASPLGQVTMAGAFSSATAGFGTVSLANASPGTPGIGSADVFVARLSPAGAWQWATRAGGTNSDIPAAVALSTSGAATVIGDFYSPTASFGAATLTGATGVTNSFISRLAVVMSLAEDDAADAPALTLFPNPAHHTATLTGATALTATLLDGVGRVVRVVPVTQGAATLDVRGLPAGLYTVRAGGRARRLVVE